MSRISTAPVTLKQLKRRVEVFHGAAKVLYEHGFPGQAIARSHYAVHAICMHLAESDDTLWPTKIGGERFGRFVHYATPKTVRFVFRRHKNLTGTAVRPLLTPDQAFAEASNLLAGRVQADYQAERPVSKDLAMQRMQSARTLCQILMAYAENVEKQVNEQQAAAIMPASNE